MTNLLRSRFARPLVFAAAAALALGACGGGDDDGGDGDDAGASTTASVFPTIPPLQTTVAAGATTVAGGTAGPPSTVTPGEVTTPPPPSTTAPGETTVAGGPQAEFSYTVVAGDCWACIASKLGVDFDDLLAVNGATADTVLIPGEKIKVPGQSSGGGDASSSTTAAGSGDGDTTDSGNTYTVEAGDCWVCIAEKLDVDLDDLYAVNGATADTLLVAGQEIKVPASSGSADTTAVAATTTTRG